MTAKTAKTILACFLVLSMGLLNSCCINPYRANVPKLISSDPLIDEMRLWTLVDFGVFEWGYRKGKDGKPLIEGRPRLVWRKLVVCYDPTAKFWIFNDLCTNAPKNLTRQTPFYMFDVKRKTMVSLDDPPESLADFFNDDRSSPLVRLGDTNFFDVAAAQKDMPECSALFLSTDKRRGNKALFKKYVFPTESDTEPWRNSDGREITEVEIQMAFYNNFFTVLITTDDYSELLKHMEKLR
jgi:hypothetical protein